MDLAFNAEELAFQKEVRDWITANMPPEVAEESRRSRTSHVSKERLLQWQKKLAGRGWLCPNWPKEYGGHGLELDAEVHLRDGDGARRFALSLVVQHQDGGARPDEVRQRGAEEALPAEDRRGRGAVVPGLFRAGLGLRPREPAHARRGTAGRSLRRQRPEDLDHQRPLGRLDVLPGAHLQRGQAAGGHLLPADRHEDAGHQGRSDLPGRRHAHADAARGQPGLLHRREGAGREPGRRGEQGLDLRQVPARVRARRPGARAAPAQGVPPSADAVARPSSTPASRCRPTRTGARRWRRWRWRSTPSR